LSYRSKETVDLLKRERL